MRKEPIIRQANQQFQELYEIKCFRRDTGVLAITGLMDTQHDVDDMIEQAYDDDIEEENPEERNETLEQANKLLEASLELVEKAGDIKSNEELENEAFEVGAEKAKKALLEAYSSSYYDNPPAP